MLFISHANPEDNEFSLCLALRLASEGYPVWCDLTRLLGGERFWSDIEVAIREGCAKFLFVLSRSSNQKVGPLDELQLAFSTARKESLQDFVIPLWIDDLPASEFNVRLGAINAVRFQEGWATGLAQLQKKLDESGVAADPRFGPAAVGRWWLENVSAARGLKQQPEMLTSNFYGLLDAVLHVYRPLPGEAIPPIDPSVPAEVTRGLVGTFSSPEEFLAAHPALELHEAITLESDSASSPTPPSGWGYGDLRRAITGLMNQHWRFFLQGKGAHQHTFSQGQPAVYNTLGGLGLARVHFKSPVDPTVLRSRQLVGYKTMAGRSGGEPSRRYWHFALEARPETSLAYGFVMKPHVLFSDDGHTIWSEEDRLHRARRAQCKGWWNDKWRDLIHAAVTVLRGDSSILDLSAGSATLHVEGKPTGVLAPVSYDEPSAQPDEYLDPDEDDQVTVDEDDDEDWD